MDCMSLVHFLYEKIWQQCLSRVQECKVGFPLYWDLLCLLHPLQS